MLVNFNRERGVYALGWFGLFFFPILFFPSVTFDLLPNTEVAPYAFLFSIAYLKNIDYRLLIFVFYLIVSSIISLAYNHEIDGIVYQSIRSLSAFINPVLIFFVLFSFDRHSLGKMWTVSLYIFLFLFFLGLLQSLNVIGWAEGFFKFLVPKSSSIDLGIRGVTLLDIEPARAGVSFLFIYILVRTVYLKNKYLFVSDLIIGLYLLLIVESAMAFALYVSFFLIFHFKKSPYIILIFIFLLFPFLSGAESRTIMLIDSFFNLSIGEFLLVLVNSSGHRIFSMYAAPLYGLLNPFGGGVGNWQLSSQHAALLTGIDLTQLSYYRDLEFGRFSTFRGSGYIMNLFVEGGIVGVWLLLLAVIRKINKIYKSCVQAKQIALIFFVKIFFIGSVGNPVVWVCTALSLLYIYYNNEV